MSKQSLKSNRENILRISTGGVCLALAFVLSQLKLFEMPMGGTVTPASTLPIIVYGVAFGPVWGFVIAFIFSLLQLIGGWLVTPFQVILDYTIGYTALGFAGFAALKADSRNKISDALGRFRATSVIKILVFSAVAYIVRWLGSVASGVIFYSEYAADAGYDSALVYSMVYNGSFLMADLAILAVVLVILYMVIPSSKKDDTVVVIQKFTAEFIGTFVLVFVGCGTAMAVGCDSANGSGYILTAFAFGLVIVAMAYSIGNVSGCHINPAVSLAMLISKKMTVKEFWGYVVFQVLGAVSGAGLLRYVFELTGKVDMTGVYDEAEMEMASWGLGSNGLAGCNGNIAGGLIIEAVLTFIFV
ncbi:MAG: energy-coupled thiamine transporter ThiT, partial [Clostridiales bacterium]|nr:energy-coupled thiamine transporter ThiT [Clostridiales bacterium]